MMIESGPSVRYASASQHPFGGRDRIGLARIDLDRDAQGPRQPLDRRFGDVVVILAVERLDVARQPPGLRQAVDEVLEQIESASCRERVCRYVTIAWVAESEQKDRNTTEEQQTI